MKCRCVERKALFLTLDGHNLYRCTQCGRMHTNRGIRTGMQPYQVIVIVSIIGWISLLVWGAIGG